MSELEKTSEIVNRGEAFETTTEVSGGLMITTTRPTTFEQPRLFVDAHVDLIRTPEASQELLYGVEALGFKFPGAIPAISEHSCGFEFEDKITVELPKGWSYQDHENPEVTGSKWIVDDQGRKRGNHDFAPDSHDREHLRLYHRFTFNDSSIIANTPSEEIEEDLGNGIKGISRTPYGNFWMTSIESAHSLILPCFIQIKPDFWPSIDEFTVDFRRVLKEVKAIDKAEIFILRRLKETFEGASAYPNRCKYELMDRWEKQHKQEMPEGDVFAYWHDGEEDVSQAKFDALEAEFREVVPRIIGEDNSLIVGDLFPSVEDVEAFKANPPDLDCYTPPPPRAWQRPVFGLLNKVFG